MRPTALICLIVLSACAEWPDAGGPPMARSSEDWPVLLPLNRVVESGTLPAATDDDANRLRNRADALRRRAAILREDASDMEELRRRLQRR